MGDVRSGQRRIGSTRPDPARVIAHRGDHRVGDPCRIRATEFAPMSTTRGDVVMAVRDDEVPAVIQGGDVEGKQTR